jgi:hypothetical protein
MLEEWISLGEIDDVDSDSACEPILVFHSKVEPLQKACSVWVIPHPYVVSVVISSPHLFNICTFKTTTESYDVSCVSLLFLNGWLRIFSRLIFSSRCLITFRRFYVGWVLNTNHFAHATWVRGKNGQIFASSEYHVFVTSPPYFIIEQVFAFVDLRQIAGVLFIWGANFGGGAWLASNCALNG